MGEVAAVFSNPIHALGKLPRDKIRLIAELGVEGDAHFGWTVQHRSRIAANPDQPNLRQVHLIHSELHDELRAGGFDVSAGQMGENITTRGIDLLALPNHTLLRLGREAVLEVTGLRNPCYQLDGLRLGLMAAVLQRDASGRLVKKAGIMGIVVVSGTVSPGDTIHIELPPLPHLRLEPI